jgi:hypothetical protein
MCGKHVFPFGAYKKFVCILATLQDFIANAFRQLNPLRKRSVHEIKRDKQDATTRRVS